ncbi:MAG: transposase [Magnetococcales bacterium]|nr:transposase [Magnetococcales bacterium]
MEVQALLDENERLLDIIDRQAGQIAQQAEQIVQQAELIARQQARIDALLQRVFVLEEQVRKNSRNSSKPPSSDPPSSGQRSKKPATGRKRGGQPGHKGTKRELLPPEQVNAVVDIKPESCGKCGQTLAGNDSKPLRHQVTEIPPVRPYVTEYRLYELMCPECGERNFARLPDDVPHGAFGFRLQGIVALCSGAYRLSKRTILALLADLLGVEMSLGSVIRCEKSVISALAAPVEKARKFVQGQLVAHADETGWREKKKWSWLWVAVTSLVTVFMIHRSRGQEAAQAAA